ncbi:MAG: hypothetical protein IJL56_06380 [Bacteroidales bacterium]|nr:hypothetical protein [Bacteroidales bacterium]
MKRILWTAMLAGMTLAFSCTRPYEPDLNADWELTVETTDAARTTLVIPSAEAAAPLVSRQGGKTVVTYPSVGGKAIEVRFIYSGTAKSLEILPSVTNREEGWVVLALTTPEFRDLGVDVSRMKLLMPNGAGFRHDLTLIEDTRGRDVGADVEKAEGRSFAHLDEAVGWKACDEGYFESSWNYPQSRQLSMQWAEFSSGTENLYLASHDPLFRWKEFRFRYYPDEKRVSFLQINHFTCFPGESWEGPPTRKAWTRGSWKEGAKTYRSWFRSVRPVPENADWMRRSSGWLMTILKNQNGVPIWTYPEVGTTLSDEAERRGLDILSLFGWTVGGHDRFYPDYDAAEDMGGEEALKEAIRKAHGKAKKVVLYTNGQLIDTVGTQYWPDTGRFVSTVRRDGEFVIMRYGKFFSDGPKRFFGKGCYRSEAWCNRLMDLAMEAHELGADGLLYDQVTVAPSYYCYGEGHGHSIPAVVYERDRMAIFEHIHEAMEAIHPGFMIAAEGLQDCAMEGIQFYWGYSPTSEQCPDPVYVRAAFDGGSFWTPFPDMYRYTFPEAILCVRSATPASTRGSVNFSTAFGYKHEIECRYVPDKNYLIDGRIPVPAEYDDIRLKPDISTMVNQDPAAVVRYSKAVMDLRRRHEDLLYAGSFVSDDGFSLQTEGPYVLARAFVNGKRMGVVVWNVSDDAPASFTVTPEKGWKLTATDVPEGEPKEGPLGAQSIRLLVFERDL